MKNISLKLMLFLCILGAMVIRAEHSGRQAGGVGDESQHFGQGESQNLGFRGLVTRYLGDSNKYFFEILLGFLLLVYVLNYFIGKKLNQKLASLWVQENKHVFDNEFSHVGVTDKSDGALLDAESANCFKFYASGRQNCVYALATLEVEYFDHEYNRKV